MSFTKAIRVPSALAILSVAPVSILNDSPTALFFGYCACVAAIFGFAVNSAVATYQRARTRGRATLPVRSGFAILSSLALCVIGFTLAVGCFNYVSYVLSEENYHVMDSPPGLAGGLALASAALSGFCCGGASLFYIASPAIQLHRASILFTFMAIAATVLWSVSAYSPFSQSASQSHSAGAGLGAFLVVIVIPVIVICFLALHVFLIRSMRQLLDVSVRPSDMI